MRAKVKVTLNYSKVIIIFSRSREIYFSLDIRAIKGYIILEKPLINR